jgi:biotin carboxyl carrier protein
MADRRARRELERLANEVVPLLIARLDRSELGELEVRHGGWRVRVRRGGAVDDGTSVSAVSSGAGAHERKSARRATLRPRPADAAASASGGTPGPDRPGAPRTASGRLGTPSGNGENPPLEPVGPGSDRAGTVSAGQQDARRVVIRAPAVGYFIPQDGLATGQRVDVDDVLGQIDVLGVRQDVYSLGTGIVSRLFVEPGQAVEYGQELIQVDVVPRPQARRRDEAPVAD